MDFSLVCVCVVRMRPLQPSMPSESALTMSILYTHCTLDLVSRLRCIAAPSASVALCYLRGHCLAKSDGLYCKVLIDTGPVLSPGNSRTHGWLSGLVSLCAFFHGNSEVNDKIKSIICKFI